MAVDNQASLAAHSQTSADLSGASISRNSPAVQASERANPRSAPHQNLEGANFRRESSDRDLARRANSSEPAAAGVAARWPGRETEGAERQQQRTGKLLDEVRVRAQHMAAQDFQLDPAGAPSPNAVRDCLRAAAERYRDLPLQDLEKQMLSVFQSAYQERQEKLFSEQSWIKRKYYNTRRWLNSFWEEIDSSMAGFAKGLSNAGRAVVATTAAVGELGKEAAGAALELGKKAAGAAKRAAVATAKFVTDPETWKSAGRGIKSAYNFATNPETWKAAGRGIATAYNFVTSAETWNAVGRGIASACNFITSADTWKAVGNGLWSAAKATGNFLYNCAADPAKAWESIKSAGAAVGGFLKDVSDSIGLTDFAVGAYKLCSVPLKAVQHAVQTGMLLARDFAGVIKGEITADQLKENLKGNIREALKDIGGRCAEGLRMMKGMVVLAGEITGIADVVYAAKYAIKGEWGMAAMHAGFALLSAGSIAATVATGGAAAASIVGVMTGRTLLKSALKQSVKQGFETLAKHVGKEIVAEFGESVGKQICKELGQKATKEAVEQGLQTALKQTGERIAKESLGTLAEQVSKRGAEALTKEAVQKTTAEAAEKVTEAFLRKYGLSEIVEKHVYQTLTELSEKSPKKLAEALQDLGISRKQFKQMQQSLKRPKFDQELKQLFEDAVSEPLTKSLQDGMEKSFKDTFRAGLRGELKDESGERLAKAMREQGIKLSDDQVDELVEAGWKGCKEGIEKGVRKVVREGIEKAFKHFRSVRYHTPGLHGDAREFGGSPHGSGGTEEPVESATLAKERGREALDHATGAEGQKAQIVHEPMADGVTAVKTYMNVNGRMELMGVSFISSIQAAKEAGKKAA